MGMLIHHTWLAQQKAATPAPVEEEELPFSEPEEDPQEQKKPERKTAPVSRRRKSTK